MTVDTTPSKLRVAIIGGGIAGLAAAGFLRKHPQYIVTVYELRSDDWKESSAALGLQTNGTSVVEQLGITRKEIRGDTGSGYRTYNIREEQMSTGRVAFRPDGETGFWFVHRQDLKDALLRRVTGLDGEGEPIQVMYDSHIVEIEPELGILMFADGSSVEADLIIGADGIHSKVRKTVIPSSHPEPSLCGLCVYRFVVPMDVLQDINGQMPNILTLDKGNFVVIIAAGDEGNRNMVIYPCRELQLMNFVCGVPDTSPRVLAQLKSTGSHESLVNDMIEEFEGFPGWILRLFSRTTLIEPFPVIDQEPLPTYVKGRTMLIGDAAHAMTPYQAQATNQALEDVEGLNAILGDASSRDSIPDLLKIWDSIRRPHASVVQSDSRDSQAKVSTTQSSDKFLGFKPYVPMMEILARLSTQRAGNVVP
ncbi:uncharacterized protein N7503_009506 [Penicillium pulvis]|uniref:uncharacterized protein n=1 Tax=Penicillium pulvis TaxID=1562058 RepID=UPI0025481664|nr:uncharacterized protein N7503_009506 [Penicillium pulvis]KAJ5784294.1 hypothetical protein N7503_009506 [Penicillium pulvis]